MTVPLFERNLLAAALAFDLHVGENGTSGWPPITTIARVSNATRAARCCGVKRKRSA